MNAPVPSLARRLRILSWVQAGWSYAAIGREEGLSRDRAPESGVMISAGLHRQPDDEGGLDALDGVDLTS